MREGNFNRVERAERVEKGLGVSSQELGLAATTFAKATVVKKNAKSAKPWPMVRLGDVCEIKGGLAFKSKEYTDSGLQVVRISDLSGNEISKKDAVYYPETVGLEKYVINEECILICLTGSIGKMAIVNDGVKRYLNQRVGLLTCSCGILIKYVWHYLHSERVLDIWDKAKTSVNGNLRNSDITDLKIPLPPIEVQKEIVKRLEKELGEADKVAAEFKRMSELADKEFKAELDETFNSCSANSASPREIKNDGVGGFVTRGAAEDAEKWPMVRLGDVCVTSAGGTPLRTVEAYYRNGDIPWLRSGEVCQKNITCTEMYITRLGMENSSAKIFPLNTVVVAMYGATAGQVGILRIPSTTNQAICGILPSNTYSPEFMYYQLLCLKDTMVSQAQGGAQPNISQIKIKNLQIFFPPLSVQKEIVAKLDVAKERCEKLKAEAERGLRAAENLRKAILSEAFE